MNEKKIKRSETTLKAKKSEKNYRNRFFFLFVRFWHWIKNLFRRISIYHRRGSHIITGYPGAGKTLLMSKLINEIPINKYFFITNIDEFKQSNVYHYNIFGMFERNQQTKKLPIKDNFNRKLYAVVLDEINLKFNRRLNRTTDYNNSFVGLIEFIITHRHQKIPRIYFIGQKLELQDTQLQSLFKYWHNIIFNKEKPIYEYYKLDNKFIIAPKKLYLENYIKSINDEYQQLDDIDQIKITFNDLESYKTFGLADTYEDLPTLESEKTLARLQAVKKN